MPWRKYSPTQGKYGPIYKVGKGIKVRQDCRGKWALFFDIEGNRKNRTIGSGREGLTKAIKAAEKIAAGLSGPYPIESDSAPSASDAPKFSSHIRKWLEANQPRWNQYTYDRYEGMVRNYILKDPVFRSRRLDEIKRPDVRDFLRGLLKKISPASVETAHIVLHSMFDEAMEDELITANPASGVLKKVLPPQRLRAVSDPAPLTVAERDLLLDTTLAEGSFDQYLMLKVMAHMGLRLGEMLAMRIRNLDWRVPAYHVTESFKLFEFSRPKKGKQRWVNVPTYLVPELKEHILETKKARLQAGKPGEVDLLFADPATKWRRPYTQRQVQALMKRMCPRADIAPRHPHDLRHTYATILLMAHVSPKYVQEQLGHSSIQITCDIYGHWMPGMGRERLEEVLEGCTAGEQISHISAYDEKRPR